ncbi:hypothetical protein E2C01_096134 [Portunus trituberculatus]|uniref:Uncharacterized protein n=1 Tax=Portunus trituberculatus TaxID=210409 RepID=A0A5B7K195_PORTR|nr:hypothetical protein [Portunus trituberculatus]
MPRPTTVSQDDEETVWVVARHHSEPVQVEADLGSNHLHAATLPLRKGKLGVDEAVAKSEKDTSTASLRAVSTDDGVSGEGKRDEGAATSHIFR